MSQDQSQGTVQRTLSFSHSVWLLIALMLGAGIFQTPSLIAGAVQSSTQLFLVWTCAAVLSLAGALCYAELASTFPEQGGDYFYLHRAFGPRMSFLYGWSQVLLIRPGSIAAIGIAAAEYLQASNPEVFSMSPAQLACCFIFILTFINMQGIRLSTNVQSWLSICGYVIVSGMVLLGLYYGFVSHNAVAPITTQTSGTPDFGLALILALFCFGGWSEIALVGGEVQNPDSSFFRTLVCGLTLITALYLLINLAMIVLLSFPGLQSGSAPFTRAISVLSPSAAPLVSLVIMLCVMGSLMAMIFTSARLSYAFGTQSPLFSFLAGWHATRAVPSRALGLQAILACTFCLLAETFTAALVYTTAVVWLFYFCVGLALFVLRRKYPDTHRPYSTWGYPLTPLLFLSSCGLLVYSALMYDLTGSSITLGFVALGAIVYQISQPQNGHSSPLAGGPHHQTADSS